MKDSGLNRDTAERMLRGESVGPPRLARVLAAAAPKPAAGETETEVAVLAAFRAASAERQVRGSRRRFGALVSLKAALVGLVVLLTGGVAMAATARHHSVPQEHPHPHPRAPVTSNRGQTRVTPQPVRSSAQRHSPRPGHRNSGHPQPTSHQGNKARPTNTPQGKAKGNPHKLRPAG